MNDKEKVQQWLHYASLLQSDESRFALWASLKADGSPIAREALRQMVGKWVAEI